MSPVSNEESRALRRRLRLKENATAAPTAIKIRTTTTRTEKSRCQVPGDLQTRKNVVTNVPNVLELVQRQPITADVSTGVEVLL